MANRMLAAVLACLALTVSWTASAEPVRVAILPLEIHALEGHGYLRKGLSDMLASRIGLNPEVAVVSVGEADQATADAEKAREVARSLGADFVVFGSFTHFGNGASLDLLCTHTAPAEARKGPPVRQVFVQSGTLGEIIPKLDNLAERVARFAVSGTPEPVAAVGAAPPELEASTNGHAEAEDLEALQRRVEALEQVIFPRQSQVVDQELERGGLREGAAGDDASPPR